MNSLLIEAAVAAAQMTIMQIQIVVADVIAGIN